MAFAPLNKKNERDCFLPFLLYKHIKYDIIILISDEKDGNLFLHKRENPEGLFF